MTSRQSVVLAAIVAAATGSHFHPLSAQEPEITSAERICARQADRHTGLLDRISTNRGDYNFVASSYIGTAVCSDESEDAIPLADTYTRWRIELVGVDESAFRDYRRERRGSLARLFTSVAIETSHSARINMSDPSVEFTIPLITTGYDDSGEEGARFDSDVRRDRNLPLFRIQANSSFDLSIASQHRRQRNFGNSLVAFNALQSALQLVAPTPLLLTTENREQVANTSTAIGNILSSLSGATFNESIASSYPLTYWRPSDAIYLAAIIPVREPRNPGDSEYREIWLLYRLSLECPRVSVFVPGDQCSRASEGASGTESMPTAEPRAEAILDFSVGPNQTLRQHITDQDWFTEFIAHPPGSADRVARAEALRAMCRRLRIDIQHLGFNTFDVGLILPALFEGMPELSNYADGADYCFKVEGVDPSSFDESGVPVTELEADKPGLEGSPSTA